MFVPAQNVSDAPVLIDEAGRTLGGGDWGAVDRHNPVAQQAIGDSRLAIHPDLEAADDTADEARHAIAEAARLEGRRLELANLDADQLTARAGAAGLDIEADADLDVERLRAVLVYVEAPAPSPVDEPDATPPADDTNAGDAPAIPPAAPKAKPSRGGAR